MRKNVLMALGLAVSLAGVAAAQQRDTTQRQRHEDHRGGGMREGRFGPGPRGLLFQNITLTDAEKTQLQNLRTAQRAKVDTAQWRKQRDEMQAARQRGDTTAVKAIRERNRVAMEQARTQEFAAIRNILTAEQRVQFDKNVAALKQREQERAAKFGERGERGGRKGRGRPGA